MSCIMFSNGVTLQVEIMNLWISFGCVKILQVKAALQVPASVSILSQLLGHNLTFEVYFCFVVFILNFWCIPCLSH